ncbi:MAG: DUF1214 domain-containing protein [Verrucomicrobiae bacterium]|nr:DUF1214 domain-containing protein [Verrucomicrobiae bacterium]MCB1085479.1 DUF1214 domain-containing protein [Verrucomicrobiae bacterium]MCB1089923.1 DUF1214 domain-containing protein [Verrucomicrobiae bacterium]
MMKTNLTFLAVTLSVSLAPIALAAEPIPVTVENFIRAESDLYFGAVFNECGGLGKFSHRREVADIDNQTVIRLNRDTLYSSALFDLDAGPVTITLPAADGRFMSMMIVNQDHYVPKVVYEAGTHTIDRATAGTRYAVAAIRTLIDPAKPEDIKQVHALQDAIRIELSGDPGRFEVPEWDAASQKKVRDALLVLASTMPGFKHAFGAKEQVNPINHLIGTAAGWGGNPDKDATYLNVTPAKNDGTTPYKVVVKDVPVDAFWSISVYNKKGYFEKNAKNAYSVNNLTAKKAADGSVTILFGGEPDATANHIPITNGWNYTVRLYRPRPEILDGTWKFPEPRPVE